MIELRSYRPDDVEAMWRLDMACFDVRFRFSRSAMKRFAEVKKARVVIADLRNVMVGFGILHVEKNVGYVVTIDVAECARGAGLGRRLMEWMEQAAWDAGCDGVMLHVFAGNEGAVRFYERLGYHLLGVEAGFYGDGVDARVMGKTRDL